MSAALMFSINNYCMLAPYEYKSRQRCFNLAAGESGKVVSRVILGDAEVTSAVCQWVFLKTHIISLQISETDILLEACRVSIPCQVVLLVIKTGDDWSPD